MLLCNFGALVGGGGGPKSHVNFKSPYPAMSDIAVPKVYIPFIKKKALGTQCKKKRRDKLRNPCVPNANYIPLAHVGSASVSRSQNIPIGNAKSSRWGSRPMRRGSCCVGI